MVRVFDRYNVLVNNLSRVRCVQFFVHYCVRMLQLGCAKETWSSHKSHLAFDQRPEPVEVCLELPSARRPLVIETSNVRRIPLHIHPLSTVQRRGSRQDGGSETDVGEPAEGPAKGAAERTEVQWPI